MKAKEKIAAMKGRGGLPKPTSTGTGMLQLQTQLDPCRHKLKGCKQSHIPLDTEHTNESWSGRMHRTVSFQLLPYRKRNLPLETLACKLLIRLALPRRKSASKGFDYHMLLHFYRLLRSTLRTCNPGSRSNAAVRHTCL